MLKLDDFKKMEFEVLDTSKTVGGVDDGYETSFTKCTSHWTVGPYYEHDYGDWISTC